MPTGTRASRPISGRSMATWSSFCVPYQKKPVPSWKATAGVIGS
jgi:hypothetical protein